MARWTSITWQEFRIAFRRGQQKGKVPWLLHSLRFSQGVCGFVTVQACMAAWRHNLLSYVAALYVSELAVTMTLMALLLSLQMRRDETANKEVLQMTWVCFGGAALTLLLCIPKLG